MARKSKAGTAASKRTARAKSAGAMRMSFSLDKAKIEAIQRCLTKGKLTITVSTIDEIKGARAKTAYIWD